MGTTNWVHLDVERIQRETDKAFLLLLEDGQEVWIPKSHVSRPQDYSEGDENCTVSISEWIATEKGLE